MIHFLKPTSEGMAGGQRMRPLCDRAARSSCREHRRRLSLIRIVILVLFTIVLGISLGAISALVGMIDGMKEAYVCLWDPYQPQSEPPAALQYDRIN